MAGDATENVFNVIDAFTVPRLAYSVDRKKFLPDSMPAKVFAGNFFSSPMLHTGTCLDMSSRRKLTKGWINVRVCRCVKF